MRAFPRAIIEIIENSGASLNAISKASGVSNAYLTKLMHGRINHPGKDKIASLLLGLNNSITSINEVLAEYDYRPLNEHDIPALLENNRRRKIVGANLPYYDHVYIELHLAVLERQGGTKVLVKDRPSGIFLPDTLYMAKEFPFESSDEAEAFLHELTGAAMRERKRLFARNHERGDRFETCICQRCMEEYIAHSLSPQAVETAPEQTDLALQYLANALSLAIKHPRQHVLLLTQRCPYFHFQLQDADGAHPLVSYPGRKPHSYDNPHDKWNLEGFTSDAPQLVAMFRREAAQCRDAALPETLAGPQGFHDWLRSRFRDSSLARRLDAFLEPLLQAGAFTLY